MTCGTFSIMGSLLTAVLASLMLIFMPMTATSPDSASSPIILENVPTRGGLEVFPLPDRASGRLFAAGPSFAPYVLGQDASGAWLYILYFEGTTLTAGWSPSNQFVLEASELASLPVLDLANLPPWPEVAFNANAARPYGSSSTTTANTEPTPPSDDPPSAGNGGDTNPPTQAPPPPPPTPSDEG